MLTAVLFDDERPALKMLEIQLKNFNEIKIAGMYTKYDELINSVKEKSPDVVFLDIETPYRNGLEAAQEIIDMNMDTDIIFVTAYKQYAFEAYEMEAFDYLLKPVKKERLQRVIKKLCERSREQHEKTEGLQVTTLGKFEVKNSKGKLIKWRTKKVEELMAFFVQHKGREITSERIIENLWPDEDMEKARKLLYTTVYYLRKELNNFGSSNIERNRNNYILPQKGVECDVDRLEAVMNITEEPDENAISQYKKLLILYTGGYMEENNYLWAAEKRNALENRCTNLMLKASEYYIKKRQWDDAVEILNKTTQINRYSEETYERLIRLYAQINNRQALINTYKIYCEIMKKELRLKPRHIKEII